MHHLCTYTSEFLKPDRLAGFDIKDLAAVSKLKKIKPYTQNDRLGAQALGPVFDSADTKSVYIN